MQNTQAGVLIRGPGGAPDHFIVADFLADTEEGDRNGGQEPTAAPLFFCSLQLQCGFSVWSAAVSHCNHAVRRRRAHRLTMTREMQRTISVMSGRASRWVVESAADSLFAMPGQESKMVTEKAVVKLVSKLSNP